MPVLDDGFTNLCIGTITRGRSFALIIVYFQKYDSRTGIGTIVSTMLPYSVVFFILWTILLVIWLLMGWPLGPDAGLLYKL